jgi:acetyl-CoA synthetase
MSLGSTIKTRLSELVEVFSAPDADAAWLLCDRHQPELVAFTLVESDGSRADLTYGELRERSERFAGVLMALGVGPGDRVATLMGKSADLVTVLLGIWRVGGVYVPLFTAFAADAVRSRLQSAGVKLVVADASQIAKVPEGAWTLLVAGTSDSIGDDSAGPAPSLADALSDAVPVATSRPIGVDGAFVHMFTSGTTGAPKGVVHPLKYVAGWQAYLEFGLGVRADSVYWCGADPGWAYGLYAAVIAPMALGLRSILQRSGFDAAATWSIMATLGVTDFAAAPTVFRALRTSEVPVPDGLRLQRLSSAGEPLTAEVNEWSEATLGLTVHDHYGQTELGMTIGYPHHQDLEVPVAPQSMGVALPGWAVTVLKEGTSTPAEVGEPGLLAIEVAASPLMTFTGYAGGRSSTERFTADGAFYLTGDLAVRTTEATLRFSSRDDDVIIMAGYRIGPFDVESVLAQHDAVAECAVVAAPDPVRGEVIEAFVVLRATASADLERELQDHVRTRYAAHAYPRRVHVVASLPKTPSGKIMRGELRRRLREAAAQAAQ